MCGHIHKNNVLFTLYHVRRLLKHKDTPFSPYTSVNLMLWQVHVGEYGVHWNFFFTLAAVALLTNLVQIPSYLCGVFGASILFGIIIIQFECIDNVFVKSNNVSFQWTVYQFVLFCGLNEYLNSTERGASLLSQNKEGIFSLFGRFGA